MGLLGPGRIASRGWVRVRARTIGTRRTESQPRTHQGRRISHLRRASTVSTPSPSPRKASSSVLPCCVLKPNARASRPCPLSRPYPIPLRGYTHHNNTPRRFPRRNSGSHPCQRRLLLLARGALLEDRVKGTCRGLEDGRIIFRRRC